MKKLTRNYLETKDTEELSDILAELCDLNGYSEDQWDRLPHDNENHASVEKWECVEDDNYAGGGYWECPSCKNRFSFKGFNMLNDMPYCPRCGNRVKTELEAELEGGEE